MARRPGRGRIGAGHRLIPAETRAADRPESPATKEPGANRHWRTALNRLGDGGAELFTGVPERDDVPRRSDRYAGCLAETLPTERDVSAGSPAVPP